MRKQNKQGTRIVIGIDVERRSIEKAKNKESDENVEKANEQSDSFEREKSASGDPSGPFSSSPRHLHNAVIPPFSRSRFDLLTSNNTLSALNRRQLEDSISSAGKRKSWERESLLIRYYYYELIHLQPEPSFFTQPYHINTSGIKPPFRLQPNSLILLEVLPSTNKTNDGPKDAQKMKILVTGSTGYLGARLCHALLRRGYSVRALVRRTSDLSDLPPEVELAYGDVTDYRSLADACSGCDIVFHAAALVEPWLPDPSRFVSVSFLFVPHLNFKVYCE